MFVARRTADTELLTKRNAVLACIKEYGWSWNVAHAHCEAIYIMYERNKVGTGRITRTRTVIQPLVPLDHDLQELVEEGMPVGDAVVFQNKRNEEARNAKSNAEDELSPIRPHMSLIYK